MVWSVPSKWSGQTAFVIAGGPSVSDIDLNRLRGRHVMVTNSSYLVAPWAEFLIFTDMRWWFGEPKKGIVGHRDRKELKAFQGEIINAAHVSDDRTHMLKRTAPPKWSLDPSRVTVRTTVVTAAVNVWTLGGVKRIGLLGVDGQVAESDPNKFHHHEKHPWRNNPAGWKRHAIDFTAMLKSLADMGVEVLNANPRSAHDMFECVSFDEMLERWPT